MNQRPRKSFGMLVAAIACIGCVVAACMAIGRARGREWDLRVYGMAIGITDKIQWANEEYDETTNRPFEEVIGERIDAYLAAFPVVPISGRAGTPIDQMPRGSVAAVYNPDTLRQEMFVVFRTGRGIDAYRVKLTHPSEYFWWEDGIDDRWVVLRMFQRP